jgi:hypothetical protein
MISGFESENSSNYLVSYHKSLENKLPNGRPQASRRNA